MTPDSFQNTPTMRSEDKNWAMACHLSTFLGFLGTPIVSIIAPLIIWLMKKNDSSFIDLHGKEAINFQISLLLYAIISGVLWFTIILIPIVLLVWLVEIGMAIICTIIGAMKASSGETYRYPLTIRFVS